MNESTIPLAKVTRPRIHGPILRKRLFEMLDERERLGYLGQRIARHRRICGTGALRMNVQMRLIGAT